MFELNENWVSTENQDKFIKDYFGKGEILSKSSQRKLAEENNYKCKDDNADVIFNSSKAKNKRSSESSEAKFNKKKLKMSSDSSLHDLSSKSEKNDSDFETEKSFVTNLNSEKSKKKKKRRRSRNKNKSELVKEKKLIHSDNEEIEEEDIEEAESESEVPNKTSAISNKLLTDKNSLFQNKNYQKLLAAKFRYLNEMLYKSPGQDALSYFQENADEFQDYHLGYQSQVSKWPINPVNIIIQEIRPLNKHAIIADLGCGEAKIADVFPKRTVHSFDLIALKDSVTACDIANVPLPSSSVDVAVFCLSLMGTNWRDYIKEAHRLLKIGGVLKIAEIESRIENVNLFTENIKSYGFSLENKNMSHKMFVFLNFKKTSKNKKKSKVLPITLKPCLYKKR